MKPQPTPPGPAAGHTSVTAGSPIGAQAPGTYTLMERMAWLEARVAALEAQRQPWTPQVDSPPPAFEDTIRRRGDDGS